MRSIAAGAAGAVVAGMALLTGPGVAAAPAGTPHLPDLRTIIPTDSFSLVQTTTGRELRYTHLVYNAGPGPLEIQPSYDDTIGEYRGVQEVFTHDSSGRWSQIAQARVPDVFVFHAEHGHFHFPLASFGLYRVAPDGGLGAAVAVSPKVGFCIDDSYVYDSTVEHAGTFVGTRSSCTDPTGLRGLSVGGADEYDYRDPGQAIPVDGVPDGTYWFKAVTDPNNDFAEADEANNETDVRITISAGSVTAGEVRHPDTTPPDAQLVAPVEGAVVKGTVPLTAQTALTAPAKVELVVDGTVVGTAPTGGPYTVAWDSTQVVDGTHWLAARVTDAQGRVGTSPVTAVTVGNLAPPPSSAPLAVAATAYSDGTGARTATLTGLIGGNLVLAFVGADGPGTAPETSSVSGSGLTWVLVRRANSSNGASEVWKAVLPSSSTSVTATATPAGSYDASLTLVAFDGAAGAGASIAASGPSGAAGANLATTQPGSWVFGVGNDWDGAVARSLPGSQTMRHEWVDTPAGNTFWTQSAASAATDTGTTVTVGTTAPTDHQWNFVAVEVLASASGTPPPDTTPPTVSLTDPADGDTVSGTVAVAAKAADSGGVQSVQLLLDGAPLGGPDTTPPFMTSWDTTTAAPGTHTLGARATDTAGNVGTAAAVHVTVDNSHPPAVLRVDGRASAQGAGSVTATGLTTTRAGDTLVAFVAYDGPQGAGRQATTVTGGGIAWTLVKRSSSQAGVAEVWVARIAGTRQNLSVTATPREGGYLGSVTVLGFSGADGAGVAGATGAPSGAPSIYLPGVARGSWVFAVGVDPDRALPRSPDGDQVLQHQVVATAAGVTLWVQSTSAPAAGTSLVTISDASPTSDQWNYAAVEVRAAPARAIAPPVHRRVRGGWVRPRSP
jgi:hypothetical protein